MRLEREVIRSRVGRRILGLFVLCALVPITLLAVVAFFQVRAQLRAKSLERLQQETTSIGKLTVDRLATLESALVELARDGPALEQSGAPAVPGGAGRMPDTGMFSALSVLPPGGVPVALTGSPVPARVFAEDVPAALPPGGFQIQQLDRGVEGYELLMLHRGGSPTAPGVVLAGVITPAYLWRTEEYLLASGMQMVVIDAHGAVLQTSLPAAPTLPVSLVQSLRGRHTGELAFIAGGRDYLGTFWSLPMGRYETEPWYLVLGEEHGQVLAPINSFMYYFILIALASLWVVLLLSISQIRRSLVPLEHLQEGTRRIARQEFDSRVRIDSHDEFEELGDSFNRMAARLGQQFRALGTIAEIDRTVLSSLNEERILDTIFDQTLTIVPGESLTVALFADEPGAGTRVYTRRRVDGMRRLDQQRAPSPGLLEELLEMPEILRIRDGAAGYPFLEPLRQEGLESFLLLPIRHHQQLAGVMALGLGPNQDLPEEDARQARQLADQYAVALSNAHLVRNLDSLSWGTLVALARAIDAKSHWTAGHSERVTYLALHISDAMGLDPARRDILHRGGLLHDLGKIGIPATILDKAGRLEDEERHIMQQHTRLGVRILEPVPVFRPVLPIVLQHHEHFDGGGYPDGLQGEEIDPLARILTVADFYDALTSERPYRPARDPAEVITIIREEAGRQFDPDVVTVFLSVIDGWEVPVFGASLELEIPGEV
jgi:putative nucleotidyltransferase with HDIG domain